MFEHRLYIAVSGARRRLRDGMEPAFAAAATARMMDVDAARVQRLAEQAERACDDARQHIMEAVS